MSWMETHGVEQGTSLCSDVVSSTAVTTPDTLTHLCAARDSDAMTTRDIERLSRASSETNLSSVAGDESPPHLRKRIDLYPSCEADFKTFRTVYIRES